LPPIAIIPGSRGIPIAEVEVAEDELELFRQRLQDIENTFSGFNGLVARFDTNMKHGEAKPEQPRELVGMSA
jgi:hypothetical protein